MLEFCPECRNPDVEKPVTEVGDGTAQATCRDCETAFSFPYLPLYTLEGAPAAGKSTAAGPVDDEVSLAVYEGDMHIDLTNEKLSWGAICDLDFRICMTLHAAGRQALFVGGLHPHDLADSPETRYFPRIERCALVADDADLRDRLMDRGMDQEAIGMCIDVNRWYREDGPDEGIEVVNTSAADPDEVVRQVTDWIDARRNQ